MQKHITKFLILTIILTAALSVNYLFAAWVGPTEAPPGGNTSQPIHVGSTNQVKDGGLSVNALSVFGRGYFQGSVQVGNSGDNPQAGEIRWNGSDLQVYKGGTWVSLTSGEVQQSDPCDTSAEVALCKACNSASGQWKESQLACYFSQSSCPSGWSPKKSGGVAYTTTASKYCRGSGCSSSSCTTGAHTETAIRVESCRYNLGGTMLPEYVYDPSALAGYGDFVRVMRCSSSSSDCTSTITSIGCTQ